MPGQALRTGTSARLLVTSAWAFESDALRCAGKRGPGPSRRERGAWTGSREAARRGVDEAGRGKYRRQINLPESALAGCSGLSLSSPLDRLRKDVGQNQRAGSAGLGAVDTGLGVVDSSWRERGRCAPSSFEEDCELEKDWARRSMGRGQRGHWEASPPPPPDPQSEGGRELLCRPEGRPSAKASPMAETRTFQS